MRLLRSLSGRAGTRFVAVLLASVVSFGIVHTSWAWDDLACDPAPIHHDHNAHRLRAGTLPAGDQDHCLFCHSLRSLGNGLVATHAGVADSTHTGAIRPSNIVLASLFLASNAPSRAPPSVLL